MFFRRTTSLNSSEAGATCSREGNPPAGFHGFKPRFVRQLQVNVTGRTTLAERLREKAISRQSSGRINSHVERRRRQPEVITKVLVKSAVPRGEKADIAKTTLVVPHFPGDKSLYQAELHSSSFSRRHDRTNQRPHLPQRGGYSPSPCL